MNWSQSGLGVDTISVRKQLETLTEEKIDDLPQEYQELCMKIDTELQRLELVSEPDEKETELREKVD